MLPSVLSVRVAGAYRLALRFEDGVEGEVDVAALVPFEGVFAALADARFFASVRVDAEAGTIIWPNGADIDPLVLHSKITGRQISFPTTPTRRTGS